MPSSTTTVYLYRGGIYPTVHAVQNDTGRVLKMVVTDDVLSSGNTARLSFVRPDNTIYDVGCTLVLADNAFTVDMTQALTRYGKVFAQLKISFGGAVVSSHTIVIDVEKSTNCVTAQQMGYSIEDIQALVAEAQAYAEAAQQAASGVIGVHLELIRDDDYTLVIE